MDGELPKPSVQKIPGGLPPSGEAAAESSPTFSPLLLRAALDPLHQSTGVDFFGLYERSYDVDPRKDGEALGLDPKKTKEPVRQSVEDIADLNDFFRAGASKRKFYRVFPTGESKESSDYLIVEEETTDGGRILAIFDYPTPENTFWENLPVRENGKTVYRKFTFLNLRFAGRVSAGENRELDTVKVITDSSTKERLGLFRVGLLPAKSEDKTEETYQAVISRALRQTDGKWEGVGKVVLVKDDVGEGLLATPAESLATTVSFPNCWEGLVHALEFAETVDALPMAEQLVREYGGNPFAAAKELRDDIEMGRDHKGFAPVLRLFRTLRGMPKRLVYRLIPAFRGMIRGQ